MSELINFFRLDVVRPSPPDNFRSPLHGRLCHCSEKRRAEVDKAYCSGMVRTLQEEVFEYASLIWKYYRGISQALDLIAGSRLRQP